MMCKVNHVLAYLQQTITRERGKHASNVAMMMRKVDKDLKDTFLNVRETFGDLTDQLTQLVQEVENGRKQVRSLQAKYGAAKEAAEAQAQYVVELEAVLDSQGMGFSETLRNLSAQSSSAQQALAKTTEEGRQRLQALQKENRELKAKLRELRHEEDKDMGGGSEPPMLPEMSVSWTKHTTPPPRSSGRRSEPRQSGVVASMMAHGDAKRPAPRMKLVTPRPPSQEQWENPSLKELQEARRRAELAESRCKHQMRLMAFSSSALTLLRDVFMELRQSRCLVGADEPRPPKAAEPSQVVERLVQLFSGAAPQLGDLGKAIAALSEEAARGGGMTLERSGKAMSVLLDEEAK